MGLALVDLASGLGSEFRVNTTSTLASCPDTNHVIAQGELDRCGASTCDIIEAKEFKIRIPGNS